VKAAPKQSVDDILSSVSSLLGAADASAAAAAAAAATTTTTPARRVPTLGVSVCDSHDILPAAEIVTYERGAQTDVSGATGVDAPTTIAATDDADAGADLTSTTTTTESTTTTTDAATEAANDINITKGADAKTTLSSAEQVAILASPSFASFFERASKLVERGVTQNQTYDLCVDYGAAERDDDHDDDEDDGDASASASAFASSSSSSSLLSSPLRRRVCLHAPALTGSRRAVSSLDWSRCHPELLLAAYAAPNERGDADDDLAATGVVDDASGFGAADDGCVLVWNLNMPVSTHHAVAATPEYVFQTQSRVLQARFHPTSSHLIVGATHAGRLLTWDTRARATRGRAAADVSAANAAAALSSLFPSSSSSSSSSSASAPLQLASSYPTSRSAASSSSAGGHTHPEYGLVQSPTAAAATAAEAASLASAALAAAAATDYDLYSLSTDARLCVWRDAGADIVDARAQVTLVAANGDGDGNDDDGGVVDGGVDVTATCLDVLSGAGGGGGGGGGGSGREVVIGGEDGRIHFVHPFASASASSPSPSSSSSSSSSASAHLSLHAHVAPVTSVHAHPAARSGASSEVAHLLISSSFDGVVNLWHRRRIDDALALPLHSFNIGVGGNDYVTDAQWSPSHAALFAAGDAAGRCEVYNLAGATADAAVARSDVNVDAGCGVNSGGVSRLRWNTSGDALAVGTSHGRVVVYDVAAGLRQATQDEQTSLFERFLR
jgi:hypothetical protein